MKFVVYQYTQAPDIFLVTDDDHRVQALEQASPEKGPLELIGEYGELGESRMAFSEALAKSAIENQGFYEFESKTFDPVGQQPGGHFQSA